MSSVQHVGEIEESVTSSLPGRFQNGKLRKYGIHLFIILTVFTTLHGMYIHLLLVPLNII